MLLSTSHLENIDLIGSPIDDPLYIHKHSNHPPSILRQLPVSINKRISTLSSDKETFQDAVPTYQTALGHSNFAHKLEYMHAHITHQSRRNRQRNIIWFNPPFNKNIKTNIPRNFLNLVDTHFPAGHKLHKIFKRNTFKVSYSCMNNVKNIISKHNTRIIRKSQSQVTNTTSCNCRNKETCPLQNKCMSKDMVFKATISTCNTNDTKHNIGMTSNTFKERFRNHIKSFNHKKYSNETELSKYVWHLNDSFRSPKNECSITKFIWKSKISNNNLILKVIHRHTVFHASKVIIRRYYWKMKYFDTGVVSPDDRFRSVKNCVAMNNF